MPATRSATADALSRLRRFLSSAILSIALPAPAADIASELERTQQLQSYTHAAATTLGEPQRDALSKIVDGQRRDLAMSFYLRAGATIAERWSWTSEKIKAYEASKEHAAALAELGRISECFALDNPGYALFANARIRRLEEQLALWEKEKSVGEAAAALRKDALAALERDGYPVVPDESAIERFRAFLKAWRSPRRPSVMVPGLSMHGRGRAVDFEIRDAQGRTVATSQSSTIQSVWEAASWTEKLKSAVQDGSEKFRGPLLDPKEPWHYVYEP